MRRRGGGARPPRSEDPAMEPKPIHYAAALALVALLAALAAVLH